MAYAKKIEINWSYPRDMFAAYNSNNSYGIGIYQISRVFGNNKTLLYVGLVKSNNRNFYQRLNEHWFWMEETRGTIYIRFGTIKKKSGFTLTNEVLETIEGAIISSNQPKYNINKKGYYTAFNEMIITNTGYRGFLDKVIDTRLH